MNKNTVMFAGTFCKVVAKYIFYLTVFIELLDNVGVILIFPTFFIMFLFELSAELEKLSK